MILDCFRSWWTESLFHSSHPFGAFSPPCSITPNFDRQYTDQKGIHWKRDSRRSIDFVYFSDGNPPRSVNGIFWTWTLRVSHGFQWRVNLNLSVFKTWVLPPSKDRCVTCSQRNPIVTKVDLMLSVPLNRACVSRTVSEYKQCVRQSDRHDPCAAEMDDVQKEKICKK